MMQMDVEAVSHATDDVLEALGLVKTGDRVSLQAFCKTNPVTEEAREHKGDKKRNLLEALRQVAHKASLRIFIHLKYKALFFRHPACSALS